MSDPRGSEHYKVQTIRCHILRPGFEPEYPKCVSEASEHCVGGLKLLKNKEINVTKPFLIFVLVVVRYLWAIPNSA